MEIKIAFLRGINVGGHRKIKMSDLKTMFVELGYSSVITYIQSGNIIFESDDSNENLEKLLEKSIEKTFGFGVPVIIRSYDALKRLLSNNPFIIEKYDFDKLLIAFLQRTPLSEDLNNIAKFNYEPDKFIVDGKDVFIYCAGKFHKSKLSNAFFEKKLNVKSTVRNLKTVKKLVELSTNV